MAIDTREIRDLLKKVGPVVRVLVAEVKGSAPRDVGASMLVWREGCRGTIGGGALEYQAIERARALITSQERSFVSRHPLGPELGQCCGGHVSLVTERFDKGEGFGSNTAYFLRPVDPRAPMEVPFALRRQLSQQRAAGGAVKSELHQGWMLEPVLEPKTDLWVWGAGHVGEAIVQSFRNLPDMNITWADTAQSRFPSTTPSDVTQIYAKNLHELVPHVSPRAEHLILTYSHAIDLELCHALLRHEFSWAGLIGSKTKWSRFRHKLRGLGHTNERISKITCPIGQVELGKHPYEIATGVAAEFLLRRVSHTRKEGITGDANALKA